MRSTASAGSNPASSMEAVSKILPITVAVAGPIRAAQSSIRARSQAEAAAFGQVGVVRLMLVRYARWQQQVAGQALVTPIDVRHRFGDAKSNRGADVTEGDCLLRAKLREISPSLPRNETRMPKTASAIL
jgi:hypothetical protein